MDDFFPIIDENINPCAGCPDYEAIHGCKSNGACGRPTATEYTSKSAVINELKRFSGYLDDDMLLRLEIAVSRLPAADVRPVVRSEWVLNDNRTWSCKRCHSWIPDEQRYYANYCLFCGADMRMENEV